MKTPTRIPRNVVPNPDTENSAIPPLPLSVSPQVVRRQSRAKAQPMTLNEMIINYGRVPIVAARRRPFQNTAIPSMQLLTPRRPSKKRTLYQMRERPNRVKKGGTKRLRKRKRKITKKYKKIKKKSKKRKKKYKKRKKKSRKRK